jgi:hypothetical protein
MWKRFQRWTGLELFFISNEYLSFIRILGWKKPNESEILDVRDAEMRSQDLDPIENFPNKIDQLLYALNPVCSVPFMR